MTRPTIRIAVFASAFALGLAADAGAAQLVTFTRGHSIVVQTAEKRGNWYYFTLDGGGEMGVPVKQVARMEEYELPPASSAPQGADAPAPQPTAAVPGNPPAAAPPAMGGNPSGSPASQGNAVDPAGAPSAPSADGVGVVAPGGESDWRSRVKMGNAGRNPSGQRQPNGLGAWGAGRNHGGANPYNVNQRRPPNKPPQQPSPPQQ